ncbi:MAG: hypothetical protein V3T64_14735, partial [Myxococcota bacterium]
NGANLVEIAEHGLERCVLWGSDYPHYDCIYPGAYKEFVRTSAGVDDAVRELVTYHNPRRYMALDSDAGREALSAGSVWHS